MDKKQMTEKFKETYNNAKAARERGEATVKPAGRFQDVLDSFIEFLKTTDSIEADVRTGAGPDTYRIRIWPKYRPTLAITILVLWRQQKQGGNETMSILGGREIVFSEPDQLRQYFNELAETTLLESIEELQQIAKQDADAMLRTGEVRGPNHDVSVVLPNDEFLRFAKAYDGERIKLSGTLSYPKRFDSTRNYRNVSSYGHVLDIEPNAVKLQQDGSTIVLTGTKRGAQQLAA